MFPEKKLINASRADLILHNGNVITVDEKNPTAEAVAIKCNRILKVGSNIDIKSLADDDTTVIDLGGKTVLPGLIDTHVHYCDDGVATIREVDVRTDKVSSIKELLEKIKMT